MRAVPAAQMTNERGVWRGRCVVRMGRVGTGVWVLGVGMGKWEAVWWHGGV